MEFLFKLNFNIGSKYSILYWFYLLKGVSWVYAKRFCSQNGLNPIYLSLDTCLYNNKNVLIKRQVEYNREINDIKKKNELYISILNYKSTRLLNFLPVNGQRTRTNAQTCKKRKLLS